MKIISKCNCGNELSNKNFTGRIGPASAFGFPGVAFGNTNARMIKVKCDKCGAEYVGEVKPGPRGGTIVLGRIVDMNDDGAKKGRKPKSGTKNADGTIDVQF